MKKTIAMTFALALKQKFQSVLDEFGIQYTKEYQWRTVTNGFRQIVAVHYVINADDLAVLDMNLAMEGTKRNISYKVLEPC